MKKGVITTVSFILFLAVFSIGTFFTEQKSFSENENRILASAPEINLETLASGEAQQGLVPFASDQLLFRDFFVSLKTTAEKYSGKGDIGGAYICDDGYYITKTLEEDLDDSVLDRNLEAVNQLFSEGKAKGIKNMSFILAPTAGGVMQDKLPASASVFDQKKRINEAKSTVTSADFIDLYDSFSKDPDPLYYKTDHHWTSRGAYLCYTLFCASRKQEPKAYTAETFSEDFKGTLWSKAPYFGAKSDTIELFKLKNEKSISIYVGDEKKDFSVYDRTKAQTKDKYKVFLGDNYGKMTIKNEGGKGHLLLIKDSYANSFLPFIVEDYETITVIDPRYFNGSSKQIINDEDVTDVIVLYNVETFATENSVYKLVL